MGKSKNSHTVFGTRGNPQGTLSQVNAERKAIELAENNSKSTRDLLLESVKTEKGRNIINELYRPNAIIGDGGTSDMLTHEAINGVPPNKKAHYIKAKERVREINKTLKNNLAPGDEKILIKEKYKLEKSYSALGEKTWKIKNLILLY